jgi:predicted ATPase/DNA-binding winged helix-turn-helix (wHTH) protein
METPDFIYLEEICVDVRQQRILRTGATERLTSRETQLLVYLSAHGGRTIPREELLVEVWGFSASSMTRAVDNMVRKLRSKLEQNPKNPIHIHTVHGEGYRFEPLAEAPAKPLVTTELESPTKTPHNLETDWTPLLGRKREVDRIVEAFQSGRRLVTLIGPSGMGKTRLATTIGRKLFSEQVRTSAWMIELADIRSELSLLDALARALHLEATTSPHIENICRAIANRNAVILILDNVEQMTEVVANTLFRLQSSAPNAQFLVTSQHKLGLPGEMVVKLGPLSLEASRSLFLQRMEDAGIFDEAPAPAGRSLDTLLERLEGIPLALELAASRMSILSIDQLIRRFDEHLDLLKQTKTLRGTRHDSLRAAISWSWSLLTEIEQRVLAYCAIFQGGFAVDAAEALVQHAGPQTSVAGILRQLADKSLLFIRTTPSPGSERQLVLFQAVKTYAVEYLQDLNETRNALRAHLKYMAEKSMRTHESLEDSILRYDQENMIQAVQTAREEDSESICKLALGLSRMVKQSTPIDVAATVLDEAIQSFPESPLINDLKTERVAAYISLGEWKKTETLLQEVEQAVAAEPIRDVHIHLAIQQAESLRQQSKLRDAQTLLGEVRNRLPEQFSPILLARIELARANMTLHLGDAKSALAMVHALLPAHQYPVATRSAVLRCQATALISLGRLKEALTCFEEASLLTAAKGTLRSELLGMRAWCAAELGNHSESIPLAKEAITEARESGSPMLEAFMCSRLAHCWLAAGDCEAFDSSCTQVISMYTELNEKVRRGLARTNKAIALRMKQQPDLARKQLLLALEDFGTTATRYSAYAWLHLSIVNASSRYEEAQYALTKAESTLSTTGATADHHLLEVARAHLRITRPNSAEPPPEEVVLTARRFLGHNRSADLQVAVNMLDRACKSR